MAQQCSNCRFWHRIARTRMGALQGECRIHPPAVYPGPEFQADRLTLWPRTDGSDWCGEHQPKAQGKPRAEPV
ncbi:MAG TPA: hypothetical protein VLU25_05505 [Acidobacteriota bacterium]|nr:hypothetical protein [Acidobacteriota bacterium]